MITVEQLKQQIPAIFSERPAGHVSPSYSFVPTHKIVTNLLAKGWVIDSARCPKFREDERRENGKHEITFSHEKFNVEKAELGHLKPVMRLINSHDWSSRFSFLVGLFRKMCGNGLYLSQGEIEQVNMRHDDIPSDIDNLVDKFEVMTVATCDKASKWNQLMLDKQTQIEFAESALKLRFGNKADADPNSVLFARRPTDQGDDLWNTFNRIQENIIRGGFLNGNRKSREIKNIDRDRDLNERLWALAEIFFTKLST